MKSLAGAFFAVCLTLPLFAAPAGAQVYGQQFYGQQYAVPNPASGYSQSCGQSCGDRRPNRSPRRHDSYNAQQDVPGDYRCDAYWDASRTDCNAAWRDQRPWRQNTRRHASGRTYGGPAVYQGQYGRPDVIYSGGGYSQGGRYPDPYGHDHSGYSQQGRDPQRVNWCCIQYRSYDPATGYFTAYSGQRVYCG